MSEHHKLCYVDVLGKLSLTTTLHARQVSGKGNYVATLDKHSLHLWSAEHPEQRIVLHTTKRLTVQPHPVFCTLLAPGTVALKAGVPAPRSLISKHMLMCNKQMRDRLFAMAPHKRSRAFIATYARLLSDTLL